MLRISVKNDDRETTVKVEGRVVGPWADELQRSWRPLCVPANQDHFVLDIRGLTYVDQAGMKILREIVRATDAEVLADSPLTHYFATLVRCDDVSELAEENDDDNCNQIENEVGLRGLQAERR